VSDHISNQRLPIPVGAKYAQRSRGRIFRIRSLHINRYFLLALIGLLGALAGALISTQPPAFPVSLTASGDLQIQGFTLTHSRASNGDDVYQSQYGAMVVAQSGGQVRTGGSTTLNGRNMTGNCIYQTSTSTARCLFSIDSRSLTAIDTKTATGWDRRYDDGKAVKIDWPNPLFPLPFALGE
jgi:hypothetical protein